MVFFGWFWCSAGHPEANPLLMNAVAVLSVLRVVVGMFAGAAPRVDVHEMTDADHERLLGLLCNAKGKVMLCGYHSSLYARHLSGWHVRELPAKCSASARSNEQAERTEVVWMNYTHEQIDEKDGAM